MSPDCAVLGRAAGRRATPAGGGWMALFFRGDARKFFLILLGGCRSEKNCAGFGRELREFSRGVVGGGWGVGREGWALASKWLEMSGTPGAGAAAGARGPWDKGFGGGNGGVLTDGMHSVRIGCGLGMSTMPGLSAESVIALTVRSHRVSSRVRCWMSTPRFVRRSGGCRCSPSKSTARRVDTGRRYPHRRISASPLRWSPSPSGCTES